MDLKNKLSLLVENGLLMFALACSAKKNHVRLIQQAGFCFNIVIGEKLTSTLAKDIETNEKELAAWMDKHSAIYRELETTYNEMSGY